MILQLAFKIYRDVSIGTYSIVIFVKGEKPKMLTGFDSRKEAEIGCKTLRLLNEQAI